MEMLSCVYAENMDSIISPCERWEGIERESLQRNHDNCFGSFMDTWTGSGLIAKEFGC